MHRDEPFIPENASILLDTITTVLPLAKLLIMRDDLTIITNSLIINEVLANSNNKLLLTGGEYRKKSNSYVSNWAIEAIKGLNVDIAFIGCDGLAFNGPTISSYKELDIKKSMINCSKKSIILCDSSKLDNQGLYTFSNYDNLDVIIMERNISKSERQKFPDSAFFYLAKKISYLKTIVILYLKISELKYKRMSIFLYIISFYKNKHSDLNSQ